MPAAQSKAWVFTWNNYDAASPLLLKSLLDSGKLSYVCWGREIAPSGTRHLQGYFELPRKKSLGGLKRLHPSLSGLHLERRRGTPKEARAYCQKDGAFEEFGQISGGQGARTDIDATFSSIKQGASELEVAEANPRLYCQYRRSFERYRSLLVPKRSWKTTVYVLIGGTGTGKTRWVHHREDSLWTPGDWKWFDGYRGQDAVLLDDYASECYSLPLLLRLLDRYPMQVPVKGDFVEWAPRRIYITSNLAVTSWYPFADESHKEALARRLDVIIENFTWEQREEYIINYFQ